MKTYKTILTLLYKSSNLLLKLSFFALPISLLLTISTYLFIENLLESYQNYLTNSYVGVQGRLWVEGGSKEMMNELSSYAKQHNYQCSIKKEIKANVVFELPHQKIIKYAKFVILDKSYMQQKFHKTITAHQLFVNNTFAKSMGSLGVDKIKSLINQENNNSIFIHDIETIDTGFLGNTPIIFIDTNQAKKLFSLDYILPSMEFLESDTYHINHIKQVIDQIAAKQEVLSYKIHDILEDTKEVEAFFKKIYMIENGISFFLFLLSLGVILLALVISIEFKKNSLKTLSLLGMSSRDLALALSGTLFGMVAFTVVCSIVIVSFLQKLFLIFSGFMGDFFLPLNLHTLLFIMIVGIILTVVVYLFVKFIFKR